jgi:hypothetical protein
MGEPQQIPAAPGNTNTVSVPVRTFNEMKTVSLAFVGDHQLIKDNVSDWANTGSLYPKPEFTYGKKSAPVSRTKDTYLVVEVELEVWPYEAPQMDCTIKGVATWGQTFVTNFPLQGGKQKVILHSEEKLPDKVTKLSGDIEWTVDNGADGPMNADHAWGHEVYVTFDKPRDVGSRWLHDEGITVKRMSTAVEWVGATGSLKPHEIMAGIRKRFGPYELQTAPKEVVPPIYNHATYLFQLLPVGGAWPMVDYLAASGECQAMVRLQRGILGQVGVPGDAQIYVVWAEPDFKGGKVAIEDDWELHPTAGLNTKRIKDGKDQSAYLVDAPVEVGHTYPPSRSVLPDGTRSPGLNRYEACLRFTADGETKYYGGGASVFKDKDALLNDPTFWGLIWIEDVDNGDSNLAKHSFKVVEIVCKY